MSKTSYITVWGDTVNFRELLIGLLLGALAGFGSYRGALWLLNSTHPDMAKGLLMGYALLFGISGCLLAGGVAAKVFKAKRIFIEDDSSIDMQATLHELKLDLRRESEYLKAVPPDVIAEMHELQIYELFSDLGVPKRGRGE